jgi:hypothetical protein
MMVLAPYPSNPNSAKSLLVNVNFVVKTDSDLQGGGLMWYARPQLIFYCTVCPTGAKGDRGTHKEVFLVYFTDNYSTFEPIELTQDSNMQRAGVPMTQPATRACPASTFAAMICPVMIS